MRSKLPKVLHQILGRPILGHVINAAWQLEPNKIVVVTGSGREQVESWLSENQPAVVKIEQTPRNGTGHAVRVALEKSKSNSDADNIMVLYGDTPLLTGAALRVLWQSHTEANAAATILTANVSEPTGYGRIIRDKSLKVIGIVEEKDASADQKAITEINSGIYVFNRKLLEAALDKITTNNAQGEQYLTDVIKILHESGQSVIGVTVVDETEILGVNDRQQLAQCTEILRDRINDVWMREGVTIVDPATTWIESDVVIARDVVIEPSTYLQGKTAIGEDAHIGPDVTLVDCTVDEGATVTRSYAKEAHIGVRAQVGPFSYLRPGSELHKFAKVGAYVEVKNAIIGAGSKVPHLSYVGDATIGEGSNIGAATIFVNYDGVTKHHTVVGDAVRIGSDSMLVAPVTIGDGAYTAAGSVITEDVPAGSMAVGRAKQRNILGWVRMKRAGSTSDIAATKANEKIETEKQ
jgi:bifunctional UDP-N-acetylglucosamine pyrophosphorylase/glucosamine-1-phosphate N-acetyltransferase